MAKSREKYYGILNVLPDEISWNYYILNGLHCAKYYEIWQTLGVDNLMNKMIWCQVVNFERNQKYYKRRKMHWVLVALAILLKWL